MKVSEKAIENPFRFYPRKQLQGMLDAGNEILECYRVLEKTEANTVGEMIAGAETFYEYDHYPDGDVYDNETHAQYYYHAHREDVDEHGHFHTFLRRKGMPDDIVPAPYDGEAERPLGDDELSHLVAISMDTYGYPTALFTTNRWVTDETWYKADDVIRMVDLFLIDHTFPNWAVNRWISAMTRLFLPQIVEILKERDEKVATWQAAHPGVDVYEDRDLELITSIPVSVEGQMAIVSEALA